MTHQRVVRDEERDRVVASVEVGERTVICLKYKLCVRDPDGRHAAWCEISLQVLAELHTPPTPVQHLVHVPQQVYRREDTYNHDADDQQRQHDTAPVVTVVRASQHKVLDKDIVVSALRQHETFHRVTDQT